MYNSRIQYAIDNFIEEDYFLPMNSSYQLKETVLIPESVLTLYVDGENICVEEYDKKKRCNFLRSSCGMQKCIDHFVLKSNGDNWDLYMIEMKTSVGNNTWNDIKAKIRSSLLNIRALCEFLGITVNEIYTYTTYERDCFNSLKDTADPKTMLPQFGEKAINFKRDEWDKGVINITIDTMVTLPHAAIKMERNEDGELIGSLAI